MKTLTRETLERTLTILEADAKEFEGKLSTIMSDIIEENPMDNFRISSIQQEWIFSKDDDGKAYYEIRFKHKDQDVEFTYGQNKGLDRIGWSSWSFSSIKAENKKETLEKSIAYINAVQEMLELNQNEEALRTFVNSVVEDYKAKYAPIQIDLYKAQRQVDEIRESIKEIDRVNITQVAIDYMVGHQRFFRRSWDINRSNSTNEILIQQDKKGKYFFEYYGRKRKITEEEILDVYKHCKRWLAHYEWDSKDYNEKTYYKYPNEIASYNEHTVEEKDMIVITKEEYNKIR